MIQIFTLARPQLDLSTVMAFLRHEKVKRTDWRRTRGATRAEEAVELAGRICYMSFGSKQSPKSNYDFIQHLIAQGHESVLEHINWTFGITGVSRAFTHQLVRHRVGFAFSQLSQQYHDESDAFFAEPEGIAQFPEVHKIWIKSVQTASESYRHILKLLRTREASAGLTDREKLRNIRSSARSVLPNATRTTIVVSANARALRHFLRVRGSIVGDTEMRIVCALLLREVRKDTQSVFADFSVKECPDGLPLVEHKPKSSSANEPPKAKKHK
jgi:thymidylate synthase (FAD)